MMRRFHLPDLPRLGLASFRRRLLFRGAFLLLIGATLALATLLLREEKQRSYDAYRQNFKKTQAEILAQLRHPAGQLALLNPNMQGRPSHATPLTPLLLPYAALDFDDFNKAQQAIETAGCSVQYESGASICVAIGNNPYAGGFIYLVGSYLDHTLNGRAPGVADLSGVHRARVQLSMRGETQQWLAPFEAQAAAGMVRGRLAGFVDTELSGDGTQLDAHARPVRDFRGWLWQGSACADGADSATTDDCMKRTHFSIRLPVEAYTAELFLKRQPVWPPADLQETRVRIEFLAPGKETPVFDSNAAGASPPLSLNLLAQTLMPGEQLQIRKLGQTNTPVLLKALEPDDNVSPWLHRLVQRLPVEGDMPVLEGREVIRTSIGSYEVLLKGDLRGIDRSISMIATRMLWFVGAMLAAIVLAWMIIEIGLIRRIALLTQRAAAVSWNVQDARIEERLPTLNLGDLRGKDELGILAGGLDDLLQRVKDDVRREQIRTAQERDMWQAVGHEIMSPLQSLMVLHPGSSDPSYRYIQRMQQAVRVLYGTASPSEAIAAANLQVECLDLDAFLDEIATNASFAEIEAVSYVRHGQPQLARAEAFALEDVVTHVLKNAARHRLPGTPITLSLDARDDCLRIHIHNQGPAIEATRLDSIFEYGISDSPAHTAQRGQGLFVAKTYMAKMGGTIDAENVADGVRFTLTLQRAIA